MKSWEEVFKDILINPNSDATLLDEKVQESILKALREKSENLLELNFIEEKGVFGRMTQSTFKEYVWKNLIQCLKMVAVRKSAEDLLAGSGTDENKTIWSGFGVAELQGDDIRKYVNFEGDRGQKIKEALSKFLAKGKNKDKWEQFIKDIRRVGADDFADKIDLAFDDIRATAGMPRKTDEPLRTLMIGGCGYSYPKYYISHYPDDSIDVVEIDGEITELAKQYFGLEQFIKEFRTEETGRMDLITEDGRTFLNRQDQKYDLIFNDAFSGGTPVPTLASIEGCQRIKQNLNDGGIYACNIIGSLTGENSRFARAEINTISHVFRNIAVVDVSPDREVSEIRNFVVFASDGDLSGIPGNYVTREDNNDISCYDNIVLRDDYCPAEYLTINA